MYAFACAIVLLRPTLWNRTDSFTSSLRPKEDSFNIMREPRRYFLCGSCCVHLNNTYFWMPCTCLPVQCDGLKEDNLLDRLPCFNDISSLKTLESVFKQVSLLLWKQKLKCKLILIKYHFYWITELKNLHTIRTEPTWWANQPTNSSNLSWAR